MIAQPQRPVAAALVALIILHAIMLGALYAKVPPHPPETTPLFGIAPMIGTALAASLAALILGSTETRAGRLLSLLAAAIALISFGPQKYLDAQFPLIWPAVISAQVAIATIVTLSIREGRARAA